MGVRKQRNSPLINSAYRQPCFFGRGINFSVALCSNPTVWLLARTSHSSTAAAPSSVWVALVGPDRPSRIRPTQLASPPPSVRTIVKAISRGGGRRRRRREREGRVLAEAAEGGREGGCPSLRPARGGPIRHGPFHAPTLTDTSIRDSCHFWCYFDTKRP